MLKDLLYRNSYARELYDVPEFIGVLATFLKRWKLERIILIIANTTVLNIAFH